MAPESPGHQGTGCPWSPGGGWPFVSMAAKEAIGLPSGVDRSPLREGGGSLCLETCFLSPTRRFRKDAEGLG